MAALTDRLVHVIGAKSAKPLEEHLGLVTVDDLLRHYPRAYSKGATILEDGESPPFLREGDHVTFVDVIEKAEAKWTNRQPKREFLVITLAGRKPKVTATFFNARYTKRTLVVGTRLMLSGVVGYFRNALQLTHPAFLILEGPQAGKGSKSLAKVASTTDDGEVDLSVFERDFFPIYPATAKVQSWDVYACIRQVLDVLDPVDDPLPQSLKDQFYLFSQDEALRAIHLTENEGDRDRARERLAMDEAVGLQWALMLRRHGDLAATGPIAPAWDGGIAAALRRQLPFELTAGQREVLEVLTAELASTTPMHRMLQGEVGSGKTIVSVIAMAQMVDAGYQCALLAPTEVLAAQHARSIRDVLGPLATAGELGGEDGATRVALLTGSMTAAQKRQVRQEIASGAAGIVIGTHALIQDSVEFQNLGLVVVDEQHRFGVDQRDRLRAKASGGITPHLLVMTATPIPRTVALTVYGDLETSTLRELPRGRQPISTTAIFTREERHKKWLGRAWQRVREEVAAGRQAYVVASRIDESEKYGAAQAGPPAVTVLELLEGLSHGELAGLRLGLMHGRLSGDEKDAVMTAFRAGEIDVLVCTTVIEVGVDVPNATVMVVMDADRFGISQLHQLRGRIGRGQHPSVCLLVTNLPEASKAGARLKAVASTLDGFALADLDLAERREGDVLGLTQSGRPITLKMLSLAEHRSIIEAAREFAEHVYETDPRLVEHRGVETLAAPFVATEAVEYLDKA